jgi:hypothetical protein
MLRSTIRGLYAERAATEKAALPRPTVISSAVVGQVQHHPSK